MSQDHKLFDLLPILYRSQDATSHELETFFERLQSGYDLATEETDRLYRDLFVETCSEDVLPLLAASLGIEDTPFSRQTRNRAVVANALWTRARKGTIVGLERRAIDVSGWEVEARDDGSDLTQTDDLADAPWAPLIEDLAETSTPVQLVHSRTPSIASDATAGPATVDLDVWPRTWYPSFGASLRRTGPGRFTFSPFAVDGPISLEATLEPGRVPTSGLLGTPDIQATATSKTPVVGRIVVNGEPLLVGQIALGDLSHWHRPPRDGGKPLAIVDTERGRLALAPLVGPAEPPEVRADFSTAFGADIGGGSYVRSETHRGSATIVARRDGFYPSIDAAFDHGATHVLVDDNGGYDAPAPFGIADNAHLMIEAASGDRPWFTGDWFVSGDAPAKLTLRGLAIAGSIIVDGTIDLELVDCTVWTPATPAVQHMSEAGDLHIRRCVLGAIAWRGPASVGDSIVGDPSRFDDLAATTTSFLGTVTCRQLRAESGLFVDRVEVTDSQHSSAARSYFAETTTLPASRITNAPRPAGGGVRLLSESFGNPQLAQIDWVESDLLNGGLDGGEVGAYNRARRPDRMHALRDAVERELPPGFSLHVGIKS